MSRHPDFYTPSKEPKREGQPVWNLRAALELCSMIEHHPKRGDFHVALTGGCLYRDGYRKDLDLLFYAHEDVELNENFLTKFLTQNIGMVKVRKCNEWVTKYTYEGKPIDVFSVIRPTDGDYEP